MTTGALCFVHGLPADGACPRCGAFFCSRCGRDGHCVRCAPLLRAASDEVQRRKVLRRIGIRLIAEGALSAIFFVVVAIAGEGDFDELLGFAMIGGLLLLPLAAIGVLSVLGELRWARWAAVPLELLLTLFWAYAYGSAFWLCGIVPLVIFGAGAWELARYGRIGRSAQSGERTDE